MMRTSWIAALAVAPALFAQGLTADKIAAIEQAVRAEMVRQKIPGVSVAVASGTARYAAGFGMADLENEVPMTSASAIRLGSIAKPMTAVALLQFWERGTVDLDAPVQKALPGFPEKQWPVTARQLLGHQAGVRHYQGQEVNSTRHYTDRIAPLEIFANDALLSEPGTKYHYTTYGYNILGAMVETLAGKGFTGYLRERVFEPAEMRRIWADDVYALIPHRARGYRLGAGGAVENCALADTSNKIPGGGLTGTAEDLVSFALAVSQGKLLKPETVRMMWTAQNTKDGKPTAYGMGWQISAGGTVIGHGGGQPGISTDLALWRESGAVVAVMTNLEGAKLRPLTLEIGAALR